jgi:hypothetical protein
MSGEWRLRGFDAWVAQRSRDPDSRLNSPAVLLFYAVLFAVMVIVSKAIIVRTLGVLAIVTCLYYARSKWARRRHNKDGADGPQCRDQPGSALWPIPRDEGSGLGPADCPVTHAGYVDPLCG